MLLLIAGTLEGFVSPIETWPLSWKLAVSGATAVFLGLYLWGGPRQVVETVPPIDVERSEAPGLLGLGGGPVVIPSDQ